MTKEELHLLDEIDAIRRKVDSRLCSCDDCEHTALKKIKLLVIEHFSNNENLHSGVAAQNLLTRLFAKINSFESDHVPIDDYDIRIIEAIIAEYFGYKSRTKWCDLLKQDKTSKYYAHCKTILPAIFK